MLKNKKVDELQSMSRKIPFGFQKNFLEPISKSTNQSRQEKLIESQISQEISQPIIKQIQLINEVKENNQFLHDEIQAAERQQNENDKQSSTKLQKFQGEINIYTNKIEQQSTIKKELQKQIEIAENCLEQKKQALSSESGTELPHLTKKLKNSEHLLEKIRGRHNEALAEILQLKDSVSIARRERVIFDQVFKKLEMDLKKIDEEIKEKIFDTIQSEKQRDQVKDELIKLKSIALKEVNFFSSQYEDAFQIITEDRCKILDFDDSKVNDICFKFIIQDTIQSNIKIHSPHTNANTTKNKRKLQQQITVEQIKSMEEAKEFEQSQLLLSKIFVDANVENFDQYKEIYQNIQQENDQIIKYSSQKLEKLEKIERELEELDEKIIQLQKNVTKQETEIPKKFNDKQKKLIQLEIKNQIESENNKNLEEEINYLIKNLQPLLNIIQCKEDQLKEIDENKQITPLNMLHYLQLIEKKTTEIIDYANYYQYNNNCIKKYNHQSQINKEQQFYQQEQQKTKAVSNLLENIVEKQKEQDKLKTDDDFKVEGQQKIKEFMEQQQNQNFSLKNRKSRSKTKIMTLNSINPHNA